jgi:hypothetical protein
MAVTQITIGEATDLLHYVLKRQDVDIDSFDELTKLNAVTGVINVVMGLQEMGWRISKPLKEIK